jgi:class 3 adenylate cyclase
MAGTKGPDDPPAAGATPPRGDAAGGESGTARRRRKLSAIMMADVSGFSRMMGANEEHTISLIQDFHRRVRSLVAQFEGRVVDTAGDSVFGEFDSVVNAVRCALRIQEEQAGANAGRAPAERIDTRIGVHLGDVIVEDYHVYGDGVNIAARLEPIADPGGICISEAVYQQVRDKLDLPVQELGLHVLKNIQHPIRLYKILPPHDTALLASAPAEPAPPSRPSSVAVQRAAPATVDGGGHRSLWHAEIMQPATLILVIVGVFLLLSPAFLVATAGALPTAGAIVVAVGLGRLWAKRSGQNGHFLVALGIGITSGAVFTNWSRVTNSLFVLAGLIVIAVGLNAMRRH